MRSGVGYTVLYVAGALSVSSKIYKRLARLIGKINAGPKLSVRIATGTL